ncbi:MAG: hypothetical protein QOH59_3242 [Gemmatimonadales bacterium]|nr:hypothetical protein [Gemmatimonadales bacterium]
MPRTRIAHIAGISLTLLLAGTTVLEAQGEKPRPRAGVPARGAAGQPAAEQAPAPEAAPPSALSGANTTAVNPEVIALRTTSDLIIKDLGFNGKGEITFELKNRGDLPINPTARGAGAAVAVGTQETAVPENQQIKVTVYLNNAPFGTVFQPRLAGKQSKIFTLGIGDNTRPGCGQSKPLRTVIDPANVIVEYTDANNENTVTAARPCPDLAIKSITKNENEWGTEFVARVTIINQGNAPSDKFDYLAKEWFGGSIADLGDLDDDTGDPLAPGETMKFNVGSARAHQNLHVEVLLDRHRRVEELDENNNYKKKTVN